jgi:hypothetical protein
MKNTFKPGDRVVLEWPTAIYDGKRGTVLKTKRDYCTINLDNGEVGDFWYSKLTPETEYDERTQAE